MPLFRRWRGSSVRKVVRLAVGALLVATHFHINSQPPRRCRFSSRGGNFICAIRARVQRIRKRRRNRIDALVNFLARQAHTLARNRRADDEDGRRILSPARSENLSIFILEFSRIHAAPDAPAARPNIQFGAERRANRQHLLFRGQKQGRGRTHTLAHILR